MSKSRDRGAARAVKDRLERLATRYALPEDALARLEILLAALSRDAAPTTVHDPRAGVDVHVADSLAGLEVPELSDAGVVADLGAGAGLPSLVIAAARPAARVTAVEAVGKKARFIEEVGAEMGLRNLTVVPLRAEEWRDGLASADAVCVRALAALPVLLEYAAPLLRLGGVIVAWKGAVAQGEEADAVAAAGELGLARDAVLAVKPYAGSERRSLHVYRKVMETPSRYPRRPGMATKRPLSAT